jgi:hypothetical protein
MGGPILLADVRLDLDDPPDALAVGVAPHQAGTEERLGSVEGRPGEELAGEGRARRQATGCTKSRWIRRSSSGMNSPKSA